MPRIAPLLAACISFAAFAQDTPLTSLPYTPSLDVSAMDRSADPCADFFQYACGGWQKNNPIPPDQARWDVYGKLAQDNQRFLWGILDDLAKRTTGRDATQQKIGDYFAACMDEAAVERLGAKPLKPTLDAIAAIKGKHQLPMLLARLHDATGSSGFFFDVDSNQDFGNSTQVIAFAGAGGLGLPDRDYYAKDDDERMKAMRAKYVEHVTRTFMLLGDSEEVARRNAETVMGIETALAKASLTRVERRNPYNLYHRMDRAKLVALTPHFDWKLYLRERRLAGMDAFNVTQPAFYGAFDQLVDKTSLDDIKTYLRWHAADVASPLLSSAFVNEDFDFYGKTLRGVPKLRPRWKRCVALVDRHLGEALGREFVRRAFSPELKAKTVRMAKQVEAAMERDIRELDWMGPETKAHALAKLHTLVNKIGYPDKWRDYSSVVVKRGDFFGNAERATRFEVHRSLAKIGKPLDRTEWRMTPPTVNAYYNGQLNDINFPAGVLQPPLYDPKTDDAPNYGDTGGTIGHELTHGFDDRGRKFDAQGNLKDWWTPEDAKAFEERARCISDQYAEYIVVDDIHVNSKLTLGEDIADLGGLILAWMAWKDETAGQKLEPRDGLTPEQRFFIGYSQWSCANERPEDQRLRAVTDAHSPPRYRTNGLVVNMPEFATAFSCKPGQPMVREKRCRVW